MRLSSGIFLLACSAIMGSISCSKSASPVGNDPDPTPPAPPPVVIPPDPATAATIGFFMEPWAPVSFTAPASTIVAPASGTASAIVTVDASAVISKVSPAVFGNNANPFSTQMITEPALLGHMQKLPTKIIRAPGGSLSDIYFWNAPKDVPPADAPSLLYNSNGAEAAAGYWYGKNNESWTMSLDNYYNLLQQTNNTGIITVNYGYARYGLSADPVAAAAHLAADWVRYDNGRTKYWEIGNENSGSWEAGYKINTALNKDGQPEIITGALYGKHVRVFIEIGKTIHIGAQLLDTEPASWATATEKSWNQGVLTEAGAAADFFIVHNYFTPFNTNSSGAEVLATAVSVPAAAINYVQAQLAKYAVPVKPIAMTEWNIFATGSMQMVSHIAGMHLVMTLGEFMKNKFGQASRWDLSNAWENGNDHGLFSRGEPASGESAWSPRPAFYHQYFFQKMLGDRVIAASAPASSGIAAYATTFTSGHLNVTLANTSTNTHIVQLAFTNFNPGQKYYWYTLSGSNDNGDFSRKVLVNGAGPTGVAGGPANYATLNAQAATVSGDIKLSVPARSVVYLVIEKK